LTVHPLTFNTLTLTRFRNKLTNNYDILNTGFKDIYSYRYIVLGRKNDTLMVL